MFLYTKANPDYTPKPESDGIEEESLGRLQLRRSRYTSLASSIPTPLSPDVAPAEAHYRQALPWPRNSACTRSWPTATLSAAIELYRAMDMAFWLPQAEAALAQAA
jgi:hypothetical protein